jgi:hypothetical protein
VLCQHFLAPLRDQDEYNDIELSECHRGEKPRECRAIERCDTERRHQQVEADPADDRQGHPAKKARPSDPLRDPVDPAFRLGRALVMRSVYICDGLDGRFDV